MIFGHGGTDSIMTRESKGGFFILSLSIRPEIDTRKKETSVKRRKITGQRRTVKRSNQLQRLATQLLISDEDVGSRKCSRCREIKQRHS